jgi:class 3 adenylate cyclase/tetratricopeptide (TPR) repeat protein
MSELGRLEEAIAHLEAQRESLGDAVVDAALAPLREKLAALEKAEVGGQPLGGERKLVTVMFADISGFTPLAERLDPEAVRDLINACFERLVPIVENYGGTVDKFMGDNVMALFGAPVAHENDAECALRAALEMWTALAEFNVQQGLDLGLHFGINTGLVIAGGLGARQRQEYSVVGDAVNLAARLEDLSERGEILVGPDTYRLTAPLFDFEPLDPVRVKGKAEPVPVFRLLGLRAQPQRVRGLEGRGIHSPLVGRDAEVAAIRGCLERLRQGQGGILSIIGEAGVGKSRLMAEIRGSAGATHSLRESASHPRWLEGRTLSFGQTISYWPFQEILWQYAGISEEDSEATAWGKLEAKIDTLFSEETPEILPYLASLLSLEVREEYTGRVQYLDSEAMGHQIYFAARRFFERLAQAQPLVLVFEDLHWADESSALLLEHLLALVERVPLLICGLSRPYRDAPAARLQAVAGQDFPDAYVELQLAPLSAADSAQLVRNLLEIEGLPERVRGRIVAKAEGNPFFLEEILRTLIDAGAIVHDPVTRRWQATAKVEAMAIPDTIQGVIMARVDRLDEEVKGALRTAAVAGRSFLYRVLRAVAEADRRLDEHLAELQAIELIREKRRLPELEYMFKHALAQEATYESILVQVRRELHARVGRAIEALFVDRLEEFYGLLAYHYAQAEAWEKAQDYLLKAGDQAGRVAADAEALAHYEQAMAAYGRAFGEEWDPLQRAALERKMGEALFRRGEHEAALEHFHRALDYLGEPLPTTRWGVRLAILGQVARQIGHRLLPGLFLRGADGPDIPAVEEAMRCYEPLGWIEAMTVPERFFLVALKGLNVSESSGFRYGTVVGLMGMGLTLDFFPAFWLWLAEIYHRQALALAERLQHPGALRLAYTGWANHELFLPELDALPEYARRAAAICRETGDLHNWGWVSDLWVLALLHQGDLSQAVAHSLELVRMGQEGADLQVQCWGLAVLGRARLAQGQMGEANRLLQEAVALAEAVPDHATIVNAGAYLSRCYARQGKLEQALRTLQRSQAIYGDHQVGWGIAGDLYRCLAEVYLVAAELRAQNAQTDWLKEAREACSDARRYSGIGPARPEAQMLQGRYEWLRGKPRAAKKWWRRALAQAEAQGQRYDLGVIHLEMGRRLGDRAHLERAEAILAEVGAEWDLARAREALADVRHQVRGSGT